MIQRTSLNALNLGILLIGIVACGGPLEKGVDTDNEVGVSSLFPESNAPVIYYNPSKQLDTGSSDGFYLIQEDEDEAASLPTGEEGQPMGSSFQFRADEYSLFTKMNFYITDRVSPPHRLKIPAGWDGYCSDSTSSGDIEWSVVGTEESILSQNEEEIFNYSFDNSQSIPGFSLDTSSNHCRPVVSVNEDFDSNLVVVRSKILLGTTLREGELVEKFLFTDYVIRPLAPAVIEPPSANQLGFLNQKEPSASDGFQYSKRGEQFRILIADKCREAPHSYGAYYDRDQPWPPNCVNDLGGANFAGRFRDQGLNADPTWDFEAMGWSHPQGLEEDFEVSFRTESAYGECPLEFDYEPNTGKVYMSMKLIDTTAYNFIDLSTWDFSKYYRNGIYWSSYQAVIGRKVEKVDCQIVQQVKGLDNGQITEMPGPKFRFEID